MGNIVIGILAHVDAGKTTLSEALLYKTNSIRTHGRVDHGDAFLDYHDLERNRGITIYSKQAMFRWKDVQFTLVDTPGHADFSTEMERTLQILDYAILVINGLNGVQAHTETIWKLLQHYRVPAFLYVNKCDITYYTHQELMDNIQQTLSEKCINFSCEEGQRYEQLAMLHDDMLDEYITSNIIKRDMIQKGIKEGLVYPCFFGSALKMQGIEELLDGMTTFMLEDTYPEGFSAVVYKISRDEQGNRLTHMKITGGSLKVKAKLHNNEKIDQIRMYHGTRYDTVQEVFAGSVCAVKGPQAIQLYDCLGNEQQSTLPVLEAYMDYRLVLPQDCDCFVMMQKLKQLEEEDPLLHVQYHQALKEIRIHLMGEIQTEVLKSIINKRFGVDVEFAAGNIIYKETIEEAVEGVGHFEPLRHYAEVHLLLEPDAKKSGLHFYTNCSENILDKNYQNLILHHLQEKEHPGVLIGAPITDMKITLISGKAHEKHTEGGDFREATYRAVRHGLKCAKSRLLEPYYHYLLHVPTVFISKAIYDIESMQGSFVIKEEMDAFTTLEGSAPVAKLQNYQQILQSYTKGQGNITCRFDGYQPCIDQEQIIQQISYDSEADVEHPTGSIFCSHGAGFYIPWNQVHEYMHIKMILKTADKKQFVEQEADVEQDLEKIFMNTYGPIKNRSKKHTKHQQEEEQRMSFLPKQPQCLLVDGYNIIHSWPNLKELAIDNLDLARSRLIDLMSSYQGYRNCLLILVFDAYHVDGNREVIQKADNIYVVYTKKAQTADMYIERTTHQLAKDYLVTVATSDGLEQLITLGQGAQRMSSRQLYMELHALHSQQMDEYMQKQKKHRTYLLHDIKHFHDD